MPFIAPSYHFRIIYKSGADFDYAYEINLSEEQATDILAQIKERVPEITFDGRTIFPKRIKECRIFLTEYSFPYSSQHLHEYYPRGYKGDFRGREGTREILTKLARARKKREVPRRNRKPLTAAQKDMILKSQNYMCARCNKIDLSKSVPHFDHIIPLSLGGTDSLNNRQALCGTCHSEKTREDRGRIAEIKRRR